MSAPSTIIGDALPRVEQIGDVYGKSDPHTCTWLGCRCSFEFFTCFALNFPMGLGLSVPLDLKSYRWAWNRTDFIRGPFSFHLLFLLYVAAGAMWSFCTTANAREDERVGAMSPLHLNRHIHCTSILIRIVGNSFSLYCRMDVADCYLRQGAGGTEFARNGRELNFWGDFISVLNRI